VAAVVVLVDGCSQVFTVLPVWSSRFVLCGVATRTDDIFTVFAEE
jgi:hypothetical protein